MPTISALGNADTQILTTGTDVLSTASDQLVIMKASVNNQNAGAQTVSVYRYASGDTASAANTLIYALSIPAGETVALPLSGQTLTENQVLNMTCSLTNAMTANVGYGVLS